MENKLYVVAALDADSGELALLGEMDLAGIPRIGEKILLDNQVGISQIYRVYDVHYADNKALEIRVICLGSTAEYETSQSRQISA